MDPFKTPGTVYFARPYDLKEMTLAARLQSLGSKPQIGRRGPLNVGVLGPAFVPAAA